MEHPAPSFQNQLKIIDDTGAEAPRNKPGQFIVKNSAVMIGYYKNPEKTSETKKNGWIYTGDLGYQDEDGYYFFVGRSKDVLRRKGELFSPAQIESVLNAHPKIEDSAVVGLPSELGRVRKKSKLMCSQNPVNHLRHKKSSPGVLKDWRISKCRAISSFEPNFHELPPAKFRKIS